MEMKEVLQLAKSDQHSAWIDLLTCRRREMPQTSKSLSSTVAQQYNVQKGINTLSLSHLLLSLTHSSFYIANPYRFIFIF